MSSLWGLGSNSGSSKEEQQELLTFGPPLQLVQCFVLFAYVCAQVCRDLKSTGE